MLGLTTYKSATFFEQFSQLRAAHEQQVVLTRSLLECGILTIARNYKTVFEYKKPWCLQLETAECKGNIQISTIERGIMLTATITESSSQQHNALTCLVIKDSEGKIQVRGFQRG